MIITPRMRLVPATVDLVRAEMEDHERLASLLEAGVPADWPPEIVVDALPFFLEQLETAPEAAGWWGWYGLLAENEGDAPVLAASGGFMGPPADGSVELGYSVLPAYQQRGLATEMARALLEWALSQPGVEEVSAEVDAGNTPSVRLLRSLGFAQTGDGRDPESLHFVYRP